MFSGQIYELGIWLIFGLSLLMLLPLTKTAFKNMGNCEVSYVGLSTGITSRNARSIADKIQLPFSLSFLRFISLV
jgi:hypothetical protein